MHAKQYVAKKQAQEKAGEGYRKAHMMGGWGVIAGILAMARK